MSAISAKRPFLDTAWQFIRAWFALVVALIPAVLAGASGFWLYALIADPVEGVQHIFSLSELVNTWVLICILSLPLIPVFALLGAPFLAIRRWVVAPEFPFLGPGYWAVAAYGPLLLAVAGYAGDLRNPGLPLFATLYELVALVATILFAPLAKRFGALGKVRTSV